jgi:hypothetical protein
VTEADNVLFKLKDHDVSSSCGFGEPIRPISRANSQAGPVACQFIVILPAYTDPGRGVLLRHNEYCSSLASSWFGFCAEQQATGRKQQSRT